MPHRTDVSRRTLDMGQKRTLVTPKGMSALPPKADIRQSDQNVRSWHKADMGSNAASRKRRIRSCSAAASERFVLLNLMGRWRPRSIRCDQRQIESAVAGCRCKPPAGGNALRLGYHSTSALGYLDPTSPGEFAEPRRAFLQGLKEAGYVEGKSVAISYRFAENQIDRLPELADDLVRHHVAVIFTFASGVFAAKAATTTIPIVFETAGDPVQLGLVTSLSRPGGNLTGVTSLNAEVDAKLLELLHELVPSATIFGLLVNPNTPNVAEPTTKILQGAARTLGLEMHVLHASTDHDFDKVFATLVQLRAGALVIGPNPFFFTRSEQLGGLAVRHAIPAICPYREFAVAGGLMSYGTNIPKLFREVGVHTGRILKGEKPADLPVQQSTKVKFIINLKTAKALGLTIPVPLQGRADELIE
jgi:putative tryptophan/tyrosine transport system substrate-binding protein